MIGTVGNPVIVNTDNEFSIKNVALLKFKGNEELDNVFALNVLKSDIITSQFERISNGGVQSFIALGSIRKLLFPLPPLSDQKKITEILTSVDDKITTSESELEQLQQLKKGLMQDLLTGKVRVV